MKKFAKVFGVMAVVACLALSLVACSSTSGTYEAKTEAMGVTTTMTIELKKDKTYTSTTKVSGGSISLGGDTSVSGTYVIDGDKITFTPAEGVAVEGTIKKGKSITMKVAGAEVTFEKK